MYYVLDMSQLEIGKRMHLSRPHISRLLKRAKEERVVEIKLNYFGERSFHSEKSLRIEFGLAEAYVYNIKDSSYDECHNTICRHAAKYVEGNLRAGQSLGITRGAILASMIQSFQPKKKLNLRVVQLMGAEPPELRNSAPDLIRKLVTVFGGSSVYIDAPLYIGNDEARNNLICEPFISRELQEAKKVDTVITSIRPVYHGMKNHIWTGFIDDRELDELIEAGTVGYLLGRAFDINGKLVDHPHNQRIIGLHPDELQGKWVIGVTYGAEHAPAVLGALRGGFLKVLISDFACANAVLSLGE